jgi:hypothetical protein
MWIFIVHTCYPCLPLNFQTSCGLSWLALISDMCQHYFPLYQIEMHMCIHRAPHHINMHVSMHMQRSGEQTFGILFFLGCGTEVWTESVILAKQVFLLLDADFQPFFLLISSFQIGSGEQLCMWWIWTTILLIVASWDPRIIRMRLWDQYLFGFFFWHKEWAGAQ